MSTPPKPTSASSTPQHLPFLTLVLLLLMALHAFQGPVRSWLSGRYRAAAAFRHALDICLDDYVEPRSATELVHGAIEGMVDSLHDRHSAFLPPVAHQRLQELETDKYAGLGISLVLTRDEKLLIEQVFDDSPASKAGLLPGDVILYALEHDPDGLKPPRKQDFGSVKNLTAASNALRGARGSKVTLGIRRKAKPTQVQKTMLELKGITTPKVEPKAAEPKEALKGSPNGNSYEELEVTVVREEVHRPVIEFRLLADGIGYLRLSDFPDGASRLMEQGIAALKAKGARALVLDLRQNGGGFLDEAVRVADLFIPDGIIVSTRNRYEDENRVYRAALGGPAEEIPMAVLVDSLSASAAEVLAGALQDHGRGKLVGTKTYGKGAVSKRFPLSDGSGMLLSTGRYILPKGRSIEGVGLEPDLAVQPLSREERQKVESDTRPPDPQLNAAAKLLRDQLAAPDSPPAPKEPAP